MLSRSFKVIFVVLLLVVVALNLAPLGKLATSLFSPTTNWQLLFDADTLTALWLTVKVALLSTLLALAFSLPLAWLLVRTDIPLRRSFRRLLLFPFLLPPYLFAIAWISLAVPNVGIINRLVGHNVLNIYSTTGLVWVFASAYFPIMLASFCSALETMDPSLEEASRVCGAGVVRTLTRVTFPCLLPVIAATSLLYLMEVMSAFGVPALIGTSARLRLLTTEIYTHVKSGSLGGIGNAFLISLWLLFTTAIFLLANDQIRKRFQYRLTVGKAPRQSRLELGTYRPLIFSLVSLFTFVLVVLPLLSIAVSSFLRIQGLLSFGNLSLDNYRYLFGAEELSRAVTNSIWLSISCAVICVLLGFFVAYFKDRTKLRLRDSLQRISTIPFAVPGTVLALAIIVSYGYGWGIEELALLGSPFLLLFAYVAKYMALSVQTLTPALSAVDPSLDEAARVSGASLSRTVRKILFPLLLPSIGSIFFLTLLPVFSELTMSVLLTGPGSETVGTLLFQLQDYANPLAACSLATLFVGIVGIGWSVATRVRFRGAR